MMKMEAETDRRGLAVEDGGRIPPCEVRHQHMSITVDQRKGKTVRVIPYRMTMTGCDSKTAGRRPRGVTTVAAHCSNSAVQ